MANDVLRAIHAEWLREGMKAKGLSKAETAERAEISRSTLYNILDEKSDADRATLDALSKVIGRLPDIARVPAEAPSSPAEARSPGTLSIERRAPPTPEDLARQRAIVPVVAGEVDELERLVTIWTGREVAPEAARIIMSRLRKIEEAVSRRDAGPPPRSPPDSAALPAGTGTGRSG